MTAVFTADFDSGTAGATLTAATSGYGTVTGSPVYDNTAFMTGTQSAKFTPAGVAWTLKETFAGGAVAARWFRRYFRMTAYPSSASGLTLCRVRVSSTTTAQIVMNTNGTLSIKDGNTTIVGTTTSPPPLNAWFRVGWSVSATGTTQTLNVYYGSNVNGTTPDETKTGAYSGGNFDKIEDGCGTSSYSGTLWLDGAVDDDTAFPGPASGANTVPTANAGSAQSVSTSVTVTLDGSGSSDADGSVVGYAWTQTAGTAVTLSSTSAQKPTFTAPATAGSLTFSLVVTDNGGAISAPSTVTITTSTPAAPTFTEDFENGAASNGAVLTTSNTAFNTVSGTTITFDNSDKINGAYSAKFVSDGSAALTVRESITATSTRYMRGYFKVTAWGPSAAPLTLIRTRLSTSSSVTTAHIALQSNGTLIVRNGQSTLVATSATVVTLNQWCRLEWAITGTTQTLRIYTGSNVQGSTPTEEISGAFGAGAATFDRVEWGVGVTTWGTVSVPNTMWLDAIADSTTAWVGPTTGVNLTPVANAGGNQLQLLPNVVVTLDGSGSYDQDGTISTYAWSQTAGTSVTLSSTSAVSPTFTTPAVAAGATLTFALAVTDNNGATSAPSTATITVLPANEFVARSGAWQPASEILQ